MAFDQGRVFRVAVEGFQWGNKGGWGSPCLGDLKIALRGGGGDMDARQRRGGGWGKGVPCRALCFV